MSDSTDNYMKHDICLAAGHIYVNVPSKIGAFQSDGDNQMSSFVHAVNVTL